MNNVIDNNLESARQKVALTTSLLIAARKLSEQLTEQNELLALDKQSLRTTLLDGQTSLFETVRAFERDVIRRALAQHGGSVTKTADYLGLSYQALAYIINTRQRELLEERSPVRSRKKGQT